MAIDHNFLLLLHGIEEKNSSSRVSSAAFQGIADSEDTVPAGLPMLHVDLVQVPASPKRERHRCQWRSIENSEASHSPLPDTRT